MTDIDDAYIKRLEATVEQQKQLIEGLKKALLQQVHQTYPAEHDAKVTERIFDKILTDMVLDVAEKESE
jgi:uncharacterized coiled-coil protein SlyX